MARTFISIKYAPVYHSKIKGTIFASSSSITYHLWVFAKAEKAIKATLTELKLPEVDYFMDTFIPSMALTLDELN